MVIKLAESLHSSRFFCGEKCPLSGEKEVPSLASEKSQDFKSTCKECPSILTVYTTILAVDSTVSQQDAWKKAFCIEQQNGGCGRIRRACWRIAAEKTLLFVSRLRMQECRTLGKAGGWEEDQALVLWHNHAVSFLFFFFFLKKDINRLLLKKAGCWGVPRMGCTGA